MSYLLAMDLSLTSPGLAVLRVENRKPVLVETATLKTTTKDTTGVRLDNVRSFVKKMYEKYDIDVVVRERGFSRFATETQQLFKVIGVIDWTFRDIDITEIAPTTVKKEITGSGKAKKEEVEEFVCRYLDLPNDHFEYTTSKGNVKKKDDESDACAVGLAYLKQKKLIDE